MIALPLARYRLDFIVDTPLHLPAYAGSTLRGAFGGALRAAACMTKRKTCDACPLLRSCPYPAIFETPPPVAAHALQKFSKAPNPYIIEPPGWGEKSYSPGDALSFHLVLAGRALDQLPLILWAFVRALARGVGKGDGSAHLVRVLHVGAQENPVLDGPEATVQDHSHAVSPAPTFAGDAITLAIDTPLRLQKNGRPIDAAALTARELLMALVRRTALIHEFHGAGPLSLDFSGLAQQAAAIVSEKHLHWRDWMRYSSRQQQKMSLGGVIGTWTLKGDLASFMPFLHLGQWLHVGKEATFGLGRYRID